MAAKEAGIFSSRYLSRKYDCCPLSALSGARGGESDGEACPAHPAAEEEPH